MNLKTTLMNQMTEEIDGGTINLRAGQQEAAFESSVAMSTGTLAPGKDESFKTLAQEEGGDAPEVDDTEKDCEEEPEDSDEDGFGPATTPSLFNQLFFQQTTPNKTVQRKSTPPAKD